MSVIDKSRANGNAFSPLDGAHLSVNVGYDLTRNLFHALDFDDANRPASLHQQINLATPSSPGAFRASPQIWPRRGNDNPVEMEKRQQQPLVVHYKILERKPHYGIIALQFVKRRNLKRAVVDNALVRLYALEIEPCVVVPDTEPFLP